MSNDGMIKAVVPPQDPTPRVFTSRVRGPNWQPGAIHRYATVTQAEANSEAEASADTISVAGYGEFDWAPGSTATRDGIRVLQIVGVELGRYIYNAPVRQITSKPGGFPARTVLTDSPIASCVGVWRARDLVASAGDVNKVHFWPSRSNGGGSAIVTNAALAPSISTAFNGRPELVFDPTASLPKKMTAFIARFIERVNKTNEPWSIYARYRHPFATGPFQIIFGGNGGSRAQFIGMGVGAGPSYAQAPWFGGAGNTLISLSPALPQGALGSRFSYMWGGTGTAAIGRCDGRDGTGTLSANTAALTTAALGHYLIAQDTIDNLECRGALEMFALFTTQLSRQEYDTFDDWATADYPAKLIIDGNSITTGSPTYGCLGSWIERTCGPFLRVENYSEGGRTTAQILASLNTRVIPRIRATQPSLCLMFEDSNRILGGASLETLQSETTSYVNAITAAGGIPILSTALPRGDMTDGRETIRVLHNAWKIATYPMITADPAGIAALQNTADSTLYANDTVHLTETGCALASTPFRPVIANFVPGMRE